MKEMIQVQEESKEIIPKNFCTTESRIRNTKNLIWIPQQAKVMQRRTAIATNTGHVGDRDAKFTIVAVKAPFYWTGMEESLRSFVGSCLHCLCTHTRKIIPRPLGHALHADRPNILLRFDSCYMSPAEGALRYVLILMDDHNNDVG